ncbi:phage major capsid protein [Litorimonas sp. RW-G-Af-16]|uniref:phage major capsid protein n=1 Tax=Litorimonas sp. RW-G-Af-16 TaxID=3241168 RepID=UPI00390C5DA9
MSHNSNLETKMGGAEMKHAQADFASTFAAFKDANDQRLAEIEKKSTADVLLEDKVARLNAALDVQTKTIENLSVSLSQPGIEPRQTSEAKSAWSSFIRTGDASALTSLEGKMTATDNEGGYIAPVETESRIDTVLTETSPMRQLATIRRIGHCGYKKPVTATGVSSGWTGEAAMPLGNSAPNLEIIDFPVGELYAMPAATQSLLDDSIADVDQWLAEEVRDVFSAQETAAFVNGDGVNKPKGFMSYAQVDNGSQSWGQIGSIATGVAGGFNPTNPVDDLLDLIYAPKSRYRAGASFVMNRRTVNEVRKFKDADGNYIWQPSVEAGKPSTLLGYALTEMEDMADMDTEEAAIAFGDFRRGYLIVDRQGVRVLRDPFSAKPYVLFYTTKRVGGGVQDFDAIKVLKGAA